MISENDFHLLFDLAADAMFILDQQGCIMEANHLAYERIGYAKSDILGKPIGSFLLPEFAALLRSRLAKVESEGFLIYESAIVHKDGSVFPVEVCARAVYLAGGKRFFGILRDISARKLTEKKHQESEEKWRLLFNNMTTGFALHEVIRNEQGACIDYRFLEVNPAYEKLTGLKASDVVGRTVLEVLPNTESYWIEIFGHVALSGEPTLYENYSRELGRWYEVWAFSPRIGQFAVIVSDITERKEALARIEYLAYHDQLTLLPNRLLLQDRLSQALASSARTGLAVGLLFIDLDSFKSLNDTLGHDVGDKLLKLVSQRLVSCVRNGDTVARLGGDEFVVMLIDLSDHPIEAAAQAKAIGEKILATHRRLYDLGSQTYNSTVSIGVALSNHNRQGMDELMKQADIAMYQAKNSGRNTLCFFDPQMQKDIAERVLLEDALRRAVESRQFVLHYQVQVDHALRPLGAEALIRWMHPERGLLSPAHFIPLAEETGLIGSIGQWVLEAACVQIAIWQEKAETRDMVVAVNVSARQFHQIDFLKQVQGAVQRHAINPALLKLEMTETVLLHDIEETVATMNALNDIGVQLSLDDFGTGYSSLQYLSRLPLDQLKIDQSFVHDIAFNTSNEAIVRTIISMASSLKLDVIAEGVETEEQRQILLKNGCTHFQGYLFARPQPAEHFEAQLKQR